MEEQLALRVHDFAKELKISSSALMKHLKDMGINVNHHMNYLDDEDLEKIRNKFKSEAENIKRIDNERKRIQEQLREDKSEPVRAKDTKAEPTKTTEKPPVQKAKQEPIYTNTEAPKEATTAHQTPQRPYRERSEQSRETYERKPYRDNRDNSEQRRPYRENREGSEQRAYRDNREGTERKPYRDNRETGEQRPYRDNREGRPSTGYKENRYQTDNRSRDQRPPRDSRPQGSRRPDDPSQTRPPRRPDSRETGYKRPDRPYQQRDYSQSTSYQQHDDEKQQYTRSRSEAPRQRSAMNVKASAEKVLALKIPDGAKQEARSFGKNKKLTVDELGDKSKHLQAKLKNTKRRRGVTLHPEIDEGLLEKNIKSVLAGTKKKRKHKKEEKKSLNDDIDVSISISEFTSVSELAKLMDRQPSEIILKFMEMGKMVSINQRLDRESLELICDEFEFDVSFEDEYGADIIEDTIEYENAEEVSRPPVVTIMGHVDHGKTSILDYIRNTKVVAGESGGITQHIGAYQVNHNGHRITFLDTPGHEAFTAMRARGADVTDVAIIVVAANDGVKPQTIEAIDHARAAGVTMIVAVNKVDLPEANIDRTVSNLLEQKVYLEGWGGDVLWTKTSARTGEGIDDLLELILLACEMKELTAKADVPSKGVVIESRKDPRMGSMATVLLQEGTIEKGDNIICGATYGHVRKMVNEREQELTKIGPSDICVLFGLNDVPKAGDVLNKVANEKIARQISSERLLIRQEREKFHTTTTLNNLFTKIKENQMTELRLIIKADTDGSVEAICDSLQKLSTDEVVINIIRKSVGGIVEADVNLASASNAIILGFHVRANGKVRKIAEDLEVEIKLYSIIFDAIDDVKSAMSGMLAPEIREKFVGHALVKQTFKVKKLGTIAGCFIEKGSVIKTGLARLFRDDIKIYEGKIESLQHFDQEVNEVLAGSECGIRLKNWNDIQENDIIEIYLNEEFKRTI